MKAEQTTEPKPENDRTPDSLEHAIPLDHPTLTQENRRAAATTPATTTAKQKTRTSQADKRIDYLLKQYFNGDSDYRTIILQLASYDPTPKKKYLAWLVKHWTSDWTPSDNELHRIKACLEIHQQGAKYFSPLSWTGLRLEDAGYHADIFRYTPGTLQSVHGKIEDIIHTDEEDKQIRKGNLVVTAGAEVAYQDERWTLLRVRTREALRRLGQGCGWCVCDGGTKGYSFPFDFLLTSDGDRYLANGSEIADRWNSSVNRKTREEISLVRALSSDGYDRANALVNSAIQRNERHSAAIEKEILRYPALAIRYSERVLGGAWPEFEGSVRVATLSAYYAVEYAIRCRQERWPRFEHKIKRSIEPLARYRMAFPGSIPKNDEEIIQDKLTEWRRANGNLNRPWKHWSLQWQAESRQRNVDFEVYLLRSYAEASVRRYARLVASLAMSALAGEYRERLLSYFISSTEEKTIVVNRQLARLICNNIHCRIPEIEDHIQHDGRLSLAYALGVGERFEAGEDSIRQDQEAWWEYRRKFITQPSQFRAKRHLGSRLYLPANIRTAWM